MYFFFKNFEIGRVCFSSPDTHVATKLGAVRAEMGVP